MAKAVNQRAELLQLRSALLADRAALPDDQAKLEELQSLRKVLAEKTEPSIGAKALEGVAAAGEFIDRFTGAPARAAIGQLQEDVTKPGLALGAAIKQFGEPSRRAPTGKEIATTAGLSPEEDIEIPGISRLVGKVSPAGIAGLGVDIAADPTSLVPAGLIARGIKGAGKLAVKGSVSATKFALPGAAKKAADASAFIADKFKPTIAKNAGELISFAVEQGITLTDEVKDMLQFDKLSVINRLIRKQAEGVIGEKLMRGVRNAATEVNGAIEKFKNKFSPTGEAISEVTAGEVIKKGLVDAKERLFDDIDVTYSTVAKQFNEAAPAGQSVALGDISDKLPALFERRLAPIRKRVLQIKAGGLERREREATSLLKAFDKIDATGGDLESLVLQLREVGEDAFGKIIVGQPSVNVKQTRELYGAISETLVDATRLGLGKKAGKDLIENNARLTKFFSDESAVVQALRSDPAPEKVFRSLVANGDTKKIEALSELLTPEEFNILKNAFIDSVSPKNIDELASFKTVFNSLKRNKRNVAEALFEPEELGEFINILKLGETLNLPFMSLSGTGGSNSFLSVLKQIPNEIINEKILTSLKATARGLNKASKDELIDAAAQSIGRPPLLGGKISRPFAAQKAAQLSSIDETNRQTPLERRLQIQDLRR